MGKILVVAATSYEIAPLLQHLEKNGKRISFFEYEYRGNSILPLVTGVGALMTSYAIARYPGVKEINLALNAGVAGAFDVETSLGEVVEVVRDRFGDLGVEEADGTFTDVFELELVKESQFPFKNGWIINEPKIDSSLRQATGITVNKVQGTTESALAIRNKYHPDIESMEGAGFLYACSIQDIKCCQIRSISNHVKSRKKSEWQIEKAIKNLNEELIRILENIDLEMI